MTTNNRLDAASAGPRESPSQGDAAPRGLPSDAELTRWANELFAIPPGGVQVPTSDVPHGARGAPLGPEGAGRESEATLGVVEEQRLGSLLHPQRSSASPDPGPPVASSSSTGEKPPMPSGGSLGSTAVSGPTEIGSGRAAPPAGGPWPGGARDARRPPSVAPGPVPLPGISRGGIGRPLPDSSGGISATSLPRTSRAAEGAAPPWLAGGSELTRPSSPLGPTRLDVASVHGFAETLDSPELSRLPSGAGPRSLGDSTVAGSYYFLRDMLTAPSTGTPSEGTRPPTVEHPPETWAHRREFDVHAVRADFPILKEQVHGRPLIWFDNAATTQKPTTVIERLAHFYRHENSNIHRGAHELAARATDAYESARETVRRFINASDSSEIVFVRGATEAINLVAQSWGRQNVAPGDEIVVTHLEHHANIVPWQQLATEKGAHLRVAPVDDSGQIKLEDYQRLLNRRTRIVALPQVSNALGTITPAREMIEIAHRYGAKVLVDGAQSIAHLPTDVQSLDADWYAFSGHKIYGPTGIGVLYGKSDLLNATLPWQGGGNMIQDVTFEKSTYQPAPGRFEAGTGNIADAVGLAAALEYLNSIGMPLINRYEHELLLYGIDALRRVDGLRLIGTAPEKASVMSFVLQGHDNQTVGKALDAHGIAVRAGHHCALPILRRFGLESTVRASLALYNTHAEIDALVGVLESLRAGRG